MSSAIRIAAVVKESLPNALFQAELATGERVLAHASEAMRLRATRILPGDRVTVEVSPLDWRRGRIIAREGRG